MSLSLPEARTMRASTSVGNLHSPFSIFHSSFHNYEWRLRNGEWRMQNENMTIAGEARVRNCFSGRTSKATGRADHPSTGPLGPSRRIIANIAGKSAMSRGHRDRIYDNHE